MISKFPSKRTPLILEGKCSMGGGPLNMRKFYHKNGEIACLRDGEIHAVQGKWEQICLEAGGWTGWPLECLSTYPRW